jgi:D-threo-aldose 1-dehydrogenase
MSTPTDHPQQVRTEKKPSSAFRLSRLGYGAAPIGNLYSAVDDDVAHTALNAAWSHDIRYFDTAPFYGHGLSEQRLGRAVSSWPRESFAVSTKVGRIIENDTGVQGGTTDGFAVGGSRAVFDYSGDGVRRSFAASRQRLGLDYIDILFLHDVGRLTHGARHEHVLEQAVHEALPAMVHLRDRGLIGAVGLGVNEQDVCLEIMPRFDLDYIMLAGRYTLLEQGKSVELMQEAQRRGVKIIVAGPYNSGLLANAHGPGTMYDYAPVDAAMLARARQIYAICAEEGVDAGAAAQHFPLAHPAVVSVVAGQRNVDEVLCAVARRDRAIPVSLWRRLKQAGLLMPDAFVPR